MPLSASTMAIISHTIILLIIQAYVVATEVHHDHRNVRVEKTDPNTDIIGQEISILDPDADTERVLRCKPDTGKKLSRSADKEWVACCLPQQRLVGTASTAFDCCEVPYDIAGSSDVGFTCCPLGYTYDGVSCRAPPAPNKEEASSTSKTLSGIIEGRCYELIFGDGLLLGQADNKAQYTAALAGSDHRVGRFKFCKSKSCNSDHAITFDEPFNIEEALLQASEDHNMRSWLDKSKSGDPIGKTDNSNQAGWFLLKKSSEGYCLGGLNQGVGRTNFEKASLTFLLDDESQHSCLLFQVVEVSCKMQARRIDEPPCPPPSQDEKRTDTLAEGRIGCLYWQGSDGIRDSCLQGREVPHYPAVHNYYVYPFDNQPGNARFTGGSGEGGSGIGGAVNIGQQARRDSAGGDGTRKCRYI
ncbi:cystein rich [Fusarium tjaetaba]|uniref:Cystein rich n=1 Tax=Fusarium tjaetaba TaxID=1567544 RepID=A0A8H5VNZ0_9HYPO|nr:cystein rich [Fusarium tjaetaba]KAF5627814.1 cystein rich [Fusarium tjaetaba]